LKSFEENKRLSPKNQEILISIIINFYITKQRVLGVTDFEKISKEIEDTFPGEKSTTYYIPREVDGSAEGALYVRYQSKVKKLRKRDEFPYQNKKAKTVT
jgi:hypothetical protein